MDLLFGIVTYLLLGFIFVSDMPAAEGTGETIFFVLIWPLIVVLALAWLVWCVIRSLYLKWGS